jgi:hypothetical protein
LNDDSSDTETPASDWHLKINGLKPGEVGEKWPEMVNEVVGWLKRSMVRICFEKSIDEYPSVRVESRLISKRKI